MPLIASIAAALIVMQTTPDAKMVDLKDGFVRVETAAYTIEVPRGWAVGRETSFGQRTMERGKAQMTAMTGGTTRSSWDELYNISLYFIRRENSGKATPYKVAKTAQGYEAASFSMVNAEGFAYARYVILKNPSGRILALSVKIPDPKMEKELAGAFDRMVRTARVL